METQQPEQSLQRQSLNERPTYKLPLQILIPRGIRLVEVTYDELEILYSKFKSLGTKKQLEAMEFYTYTHINYNTTMIPTTTFNTAIHIHSCSLNNSEYTKAYKLCDIFNLPAITEEEEKATTYLVDAVKYELQLIKVANRALKLRRTKARIKANRSNNKPPKSHRRSVVRTPINPYTAKNLHESLHKIFMVDEPYRLEELRQPEYTSYTTKIYDMDTGQLLPNTLIELTYDTFDYLVRKKHLKYLDVYKTSRKYYKVMAARKIPNDSEFLSLHGERYFTDKHKMAGYFNFFKKDYSSFPHYDKYELNDKRKLRTVDLGYLEHKKQEEAEKAEKERVKLQKEREKESALPKEIILTSPIKPLNQHKK